MFRLLRVDRRGFLTPLKGHHGFTLMEVLIAIAILAIVMAIVYGSFVQTRRVIDRAEGAVDELRGVRVAFNRMMLDLNMAFISTPVSQTPPQTTQNNESTFFVGTDGVAGGYPNDSIDFTSFSNKIRSRDARESDQMEVGYYLKRDYEGKAVLMKREKKRLDKNPMYGGKSYEITEDIVGLNFRYLKEGAWYDSWDSRAKSPVAIPEAVEITIIVKESDEVESSYKTVVEIPLGKKS